MSWWGYVERVAATSRQRDISEKADVDATEVTRWKQGKVPSAKNAAAFARGYERPVLEAFVAAGFLTAEEAGERPAAAPDLTRLTNDELLELVRARMRERGELGGDTAATREAESRRAFLAAQIQEGLVARGAGRDQTHKDETSEKSGESA